MIRRTLSFVFALSSLISAASAQPPGDRPSIEVSPELKRYDGRILQIWADAEDMVIVLDRNGPCGSAFFHIPRTAKNFDEATAVALTALAADKRVQLVVLWQRPLIIANCISRDPGGPTDRQVVDHLAVFR